jgi:hypothetical protein
LKASPRVGGPSRNEKGSALPIEGIVSKHIDAPYTPDNRALWRKVKCLHRDEFVVVGWTDPEGGDLISVPCCSPITIRRNGWSVPAAPTPVSGYSTAISHLPPRDSSTRQPIV